MPRSLLIHWKSAKGNITMVAQNILEHYITRMLDKTVTKLAAETGAPDGKNDGKNAGFQPFYAVEGDLSAGLVLVCDHARNTMPEEYGSLGLPPHQLERHIGYDIGAEAVTLNLAERLGVPAVFSCFSRLLIDPNRGVDDPTLVMRLSDGAVVPGNAMIDEVEITKRKTHYYLPYHTAIADLLDACAEAGNLPAILSVHSFTPAWKGVPRPWHAGVLWDKDARFAVPLIGALKQSPELVVGDNEPYTGELEGDTMNVHGTARGLAHALIEIRQDLITSEAGIAEWVDRLEEILPTLITDPQLHEAEFF
jgi:predicted N-formylglutamate amidohydrolase